ncbi:MAG: flagellar assembly protein FliH [Verrucomicrobiota bacterium]|jgi:flagellar assembly protein FliH
MTRAGHSIPFPQPLRGVRFSGSSSSEEALARQMEDREKAAGELGRQQGEKALSEQLLQQRAEMLQLQQGVLESLRRTIPQVVRDSEHALAALALEVARKLVSGLPISAEMVEASIHEALAQVEETTECHIHLHPDDCALLEQFDPGFLSGRPGPVRTHFHRTAGVERGGCLVKTRFGIIDVQRDTKMALLEKSLLA